MSMRDYLSAIFEVAGMGAEIRRQYRRDPLEGIDIEEEYALIQQKCSKLPASMRRMVVARVERGAR